MTTKNDTAKIRGKTAAVPGKPRTAAPDPGVSESFQARFPRLRLVNLKTSGAESTEASFSIAGSGEDLIDAGLLTQYMIDAIPRCGVKFFTHREPQTAGIYGTVHRIAGGFRVCSYVDSGDIFGVHAGLREAFGLKRKEFAGRAAFSTMFPGLQVTEEPELVFGETALRVWIAGERSDDFVRAGFATQAMSDTVDKYERFDQMDGEHRGTAFERLLGGQGYRLRVDFGLDAKGVAETVCKLFSKGPQPVPQPPAARLARAFQTVREWKTEQSFGVSTSLSCMNGHRTPEPGRKEIYEAIYGARFRFADSDVQRIDSIICRFRAELNAAIKQAAVVDQARSHLRLAVSNEAQT